MITRRERERKEERELQSSRKCPRHKNQSYVVNGKFEEIRFTLETKHPLRERQTLFCQIESYWFQSPPRNSLPRFAYFTRCIITHFPFNFFILSFFFLFIRWLIILLVKTYTHTCTRAFEKIPRSIIHRTYSLINLLNFILPRQFLCATFQWKRNVIPECN